MLNTYHQVYIQLVGVKGRKPLFRLNGVFEYLSCLRHFLSTVADYPKVSPRGFMIDHASGIPVFIK